jgi:hypothetical protein
VPDAQLQGCELSVQQLAGHTPGATAADDPACGRLQIVLQIGFCGALQGTIAEGAPVVPISAQLKYNIDAVCEYIVKKIPVPVR